MGDDVAIVADQDRIGEAEGADAAGDLGDLRIAVSAGIARVRDASQASASLILLGFGVCDQLTLFEPPNLAIAMTQDRFHVANFPAQS
jgi:hypothetical protein